MTTRTDSNAGQPQDDGNDTSGGGLRKQLEKALADNKQLKAGERARAFTDAGLDTSVGLGKAISQVYEGEPTAEAVLAFATDEYGFVPTTGAPAVHPQAAQIALGHQQLDQVGNVAGSLQESSRLERLQAASAEGNFGQTGAIKAAQMQDMMDRQNNPR